MGCESFFQIKRFCCCCSLKIGSLIIGYLGLLTHVLQTAGGSAHLHYIKSLTPFFVEHGTNNSDSSASYEFSGIQGLYIQYMAIIVAYHVISILFHVALLWGIHKNKPECILPWLVITGFETILFMAVAIGATIFYITKPAMDVRILFLIITIFVVCCWLAVYFCMCVYSYYLEIKFTSETETEEKDFPPAYIKSFTDDKKQNISCITLTQNDI